MKRLSDPNAPQSDLLETPEASRRRVLQMLGAAGLAGLPTWSFGQPTARTASTPLNAFTSNFQLAPTYRFSVGFRF